MFLKVATFIFAFVLQNISATPPFESNNDQRQMHESIDAVLGTPTRVEHLPAAEPLLPAHSLVRPSLGMLKSAIKYPHKEVATLYGSTNNLGLAYDGNKEIVTYSDFRRSAQPHYEFDDILQTNQEMPSLLFLQLYLDRLNSLLRSVQQPATSRLMYGFRRSNSKKKQDERNYRGNPGNPFTVHHNRYLQNYIWNLAMTGDHINVNPNAPEFKEPMPADVDGIRKWWYFHQDDYKPFSRR